MMNKGLLQRYVYALLALILTVYALEKASQVLMPLTFALVFALLLMPLSAWLERLRLPRAIAALVCTGLFFVVQFIIISLISAEVVFISNDLPAISSQIEEKVNVLERFISNNLNIDASSQQQFLQAALSNLARNSSVLLGRTANATADALATFTLVVLGQFFFLYYRSFFKSFLIKALASVMPNQALDIIIVDIKKAVQNYVIGLFTVVAILAVLYFVGLNLFGIKYALFFSLVGALFTIIPYVGTTFGATLPVLFALLTKDSAWYAVGLVGMFWLIQLLEGNVITPNVIGSRVSINPFAAIIGLFIGGLIWGAGGLILALPVLAMLKAIFDQIEPLKPYGYLLGAPKIKPRRKKKAATAPMQD